MNYLSRWSDSLISSPSLKLGVPVEVVGERNHHIGPTQQYARVEVVAEPSPVFEIVDNVDSLPGLQELKYPECVVFGILDVLMVARSMPLSRVKLTLKAVDWNAINTSTVAFREAGRDAGRKILASASVT